MAENRKWKIGDVVALKSGGPAMTIVAEQQDGDDQSVKCAWFRGGHQQACELMSDEFEPESLCVSEPDKRNMFW